MRGPRGFNTSFTRFEIEKATETGGLQYVTGRGLFGERFEEVLRAEPHGFASSPPAGSVGLALPIGGRRDQIAVFGVEHPAHRPAGLNSGESVLYDAKGQVVFLKQDGIRVHTSENLVHAAQGRTRMVLAEGKYAQIKIKENDDPDNGGATLMHITIDFEAGEIIMSQAPIIGPDPKPVY